MKLQLLAISLVTLFGASSFAHLELGIYAGKRPTGEACTFEVKSISFRDNVRHPLNEKVVISAEGATVELNHRPVVDLTAATVLAEKEILTGTVGVPMAAWGAVLQMAETEDGHGPSVLSVIYDDYKRPENDKMFVCKELKYQEN